MSERKFGLYVRLGTEVRNLIVSGLADKLKRYGEVVIVTHNDNKTLSQLAQSYNLKQEILPKWNSLKRKPIEGYFLSSRRSRLRLKGIKTFELLKNSPDFTFKDYFKGNLIVYSFLKFITLKVIKRAYFVTSLADYLKNGNFTDIVMQSYYAPEQMAMGVTANEAFCKVWVTSWSWKEFYINEFISFHPTAIFVWSKKLENLYRQYNTHINKGSIISIGNLSYDLFFGFTPIRSIQYYADKYNFPANKPLIIYTMVNPIVYNNEHLIIKMLVAAIKKQYKDPPILLLKPNPMDTTVGRFDFVKEEGDVVMLENLWIYDSDINFNTVSAEGQIEWMDLLYYSKLNISIPSTVTIEALLMKVPVINIVFDEENKINNQIEYLAKAVFYKDLFHRNDVVLTSDINDVLHHINRFLSEENIYFEPLDDFVCMNGSSTEETANIISKN